MNAVMEKDNVQIEDMIYEIKGVQVMTAFDLAKLYQCKNGTKEINQAVKNNPEKFPERFSWILSNEESNIFLVKNFDQKKETRGGKYKNIRVFTESGIAMLSTILHTSVAIEISIKIMDAFVTMRHYLVSNKDIYISLNNINNKLINHENKLLEYDGKFNALFSKFDAKEQLFLKNQSYTAYKNVLEILNSAKKIIIVVDEYADIIFLDLIKNIKCNIILITRDSNRLSDIEIKKYNKEFNNLKVVRDSSFHDRFLIIDRNNIYLLGASINSIGDKMSMIIKLEDKQIIETLINNVEDIIYK